MDIASQLCRADVSVIFRLEGGVYRFAAGYSLDPAYLEHERRTPISPGPGTVVGRAAMSREVVQIEDAWTDPLYEQKAAVKISGGRSMIGVPLMREGEPIGVIGLARTRVDPFTQREIELVTTFADQAVIAIENVRLFEGNCAPRASSRWISRPRPRKCCRSSAALPAIFIRCLSHAGKGCAYLRRQVRKYLPLGWRAFRLVAAHNTPPALVEARRQSPLRPAVNDPIGRMMTTKAVIHVPDAREEEEYVEREPSIVVGVELGGVRTFVAVPMLKENELIGAS